MKLFLECRMGASGDMIMAALYELLPDKKAFREKMERLGLPGVKLEYSASTKCGITGTHVSVKVSGVEEKSEDMHIHASEPDQDQSAVINKKQSSVKAHDHSHDQSNIQSHTHAHDGDGHTHAHDGDGHTHAHDGDGHTHAHDGDGHTHAHDGDGHTHVHDDGSQHNHSHNGKRYSYNEILAIIRGIGLPDNILEDALGVYRILGEAEAKVHGVPLGELHLHEVGALDAVADVVGCCLAINMLGATDITASPIHVGSGSVLCEHGILPVPAPAAAEILKGIPIYGGSISGELCTPTGAALLKRFVKKFGDMPTMIVAKIGCGMGTKDFEAANCLRAFLCEDDTHDGGDRDSVFEISCNLDDMTPEAVGAAFDILFENGALDVYTSSVTMKKNRQAVILSCICPEAEREQLTRVMLTHTSTLGVRVSQHSRSVMTRSVETVSTKYGDIRIKRAHGFGVIKNKPEYDDVLSASKQYNVPFATVYDAVIKTER